MTPAWQDSLITSQSVAAEFTIAEYSKRRQFNNTYFSPPFTTSTQGYHFFLRMDANGVLSGEGSHLSIYAYIMKGQHDDCLRWPFTGDITFELINWLEDKGHYKKTTSVKNFFGITEGEYGNATGFHTFISQSSLLLNSSTNTQYLYKDCIRVRVQAIATNV